MLEVLTITAGIFKRSSNHVKDLPNGYGAATWREFTDQGLLLSDLGNPDWSVGLQCVPHSQIARETAA